MIPAVLKGRTYQMLRPIIGKCVIINQENFVNLSKRIGTSVDRNSLIECFTKLKFEISVWDDLKVNEIVQNILELSEKDFTKYNCLVICVSTHGGEDGVLHAKDGRYNLQSLLEPFKSDACRTLAGKPKILIIQACRGQSRDPGSIVDFDTFDGPPKSISIRLPQWADFLIGYSTMSDHVSFRNRAKGSWFIESFCSVLMAEYEVSDLVSILTITNQKVAQDYESNAEKYKQMPVMFSSLTGKIYLHQKKKIKRSSSDSRLTDREDIRSKYGFLVEKKDFQTEQAYLNQRIKKLE